MEQVPGIINQTVDSTSEPEFNFQLQLSQSGAYSRFLQPEVPSGSGQLLRPLLGWLIPPRELESKKEREEPGC